jgi:hypothetical protein
MFFLVGAVSAQAGNLDALKATAKSYVLAIQSALGLSETSSCPQIIAVATEYAKAKIAYYDAARAAMPLLLQYGRPAPSIERRAEAREAIFNFAKRQTRCRRQWCGSQRVVYGEFGPHVSRRCAN